MPATAKFLQAVAELPQGAVVLPGLDTDLDDDAWQTIGGVRDAKGGFTEPPPRTIRNMRCMRCWSASASGAAMSKFSASRAQGGREVLLSEAMRPSNATRAMA